LTIVTGAQPLTVNGASRNLAISPDGTRVAWIGNNGTQLVVRALDQLEPTPTPVLTANPLGMFFSPDGQSLGVFDAGGNLQIMPVSGGPAVLVTKADGLPLGSSWGSDGAIVFATTNATTGLQRVASTGGPEAVLTRPNRDRGEADHRWPQVLRGSDAILFTIAPLSGGVGQSQIAVLSLKTGTQKIVLRGASDARYVSGGYLVYAGPTGAIWAVGFNLDTMEATGNPVRVLTEAPVSSFGAADFDVAENGTLVYVRGEGQAVGRTLVWVDRNGIEEGTNIPPRAYLNPRLSPDGARVAIESRDGDGDIWIWDFTRHTLRNLTLHPAADRYPVWTPDGTRIVYTSDRDGVLNLYWQAVDGSGTPERLTTSPNPQSPTAVAADGSRVVFHESGRSADLMTVTLGPDHAVRGLLQTASNEQNGTLSPDGRWLAYQSNEASQIGQFEIHVRPLVDVNSGHWQVTTGGGVRATWSRDGRELYYLTLKGALIRIPIESGPIFTPGPPTRVVEGDYYFGVAGSPRTYDVSPNGRRFLMIKPVNETSTPASLVVVQRWIDELRREVPTR
jgi:serine/threonine-protein kinase